MMPEVGLFQHSSWKTLRSWGVSMPRYVVLPAQGFRNDVLRNEFPVRGSKVFSAVASPGLDLAVGPSMEVLDSIHEDGPKLVEMSESAELNLRLSVPGMMVV